MTQAEALDIMKLGHNVFITGPAGSGKTHLLNEYISFLKDNYVDIGITASTGIAATHMGGLTIHSWTGLGIKDRLTEHDLEELKERKYLRDRFVRTQVLIIDEVSMLHHFRLDLIDRICRFMRGTDQPFGGLQVILCGDFFQLPPVSRAGEPLARFAYEAEIWREADFRICYLEEQHRQTDGAFLKLLNEIRKNQLSDEGFKHLLSRKKTQTPSPRTAEPTRLYTHNIDVDEINQRELLKLHGQTKEYRMDSHGQRPLAEILKKSCLAPEILKLKVGAKVMFVKNNFEEGYVNGTLGQVMGFEPEGPIVQIASGRIIHVRPATWQIEEDGKSKAALNQYPLRLAWAITVHKSQGMSLEAVEVDLSKSFERGMGYVALSRVRSLAGLTLLGLNDLAVQVRGEVLDFDRELKKISNRHLAELTALTDKEKKERQEKFLRRISPARTPSGRVKKKKLPPQEETRKYLESGMNLNEIANARGIKIGTVLDHLEKLLAEDSQLDIRCLTDEIPHNKFKRISQAFMDTYGDNRELRLTPVMKVLEKEGGRFIFEELRLVRLFLKKRGM